MFCSNDCFSAENAGSYFRSVVCNGSFRIHNPKVGGSIPPPATNFSNVFKCLDAIGNLEKKLKSHFCCKLFLPQAFRANRILEKPQHFYIRKCDSHVLGSYNPTVAS